MDDLFKDIKYYTNDNGRINTKYDKITLFLKIFLKID
jgi:hypothetical protein